MQRYYRCLTIAGSDSGGGAGIQADLKTFSALGTYGTSAITAITAQNTIGVTAIHPIPTDLIEAQIVAVLTDIGTDAVKIGMLHNRAAAELVIRMLNRFKPPHVVLDPVMIATSGDRLIEEDTIRLIRSELLPFATLVTPNIDEARLLSDLPVETVDQMEAAAERLHEMGVKAVLMKGGHLRGDQAIDLFCEAGKESVRLSVPFIDSNNTHGTGCTLSSAITAYLAQGYPLESAVRQAKQYITQAIEAGASVFVGSGHGPLNHFFAPHPLRSRTTLS